MQLPSGVELQSANTNYGMCDTNNLPILTCELTNLSVNSADSISHVTVNVDVVLIDAGLLLLILEAKVTANEYPAHLVNKRTKVFIGNVKVDSRFLFFGEKQKPRI